MSTDIKLYTGEEEAYFSQGQLNELDKPLDMRLISKRKGGFGKMLSYIEGHDAIDQANRIFGYGNWCYRPLSVEQVVLLDPLSGEAVGIEYKSQVELTVRGAIGPIIDIGSQPVATWNVEDQIMQRRLKSANGGKVNEAEFTLIEKREARAVIVEAHEQAKKGAVTDALKRALRAFGNQFGNGLYGDGHVDLSEPEPTSRTVVNAVQPKQIAAPPQTRSIEQDEALRELARPGPARAGKNLQVQTQPASVKAQIFQAGKAKGMWDEPKAFYAACSALLDGKPINAQTWGELLAQDIMQIEQMVRDEPSVKSA